MAYGRIPESFIDDVLLKTDIVDLIDSRVKLKKAGKNYAACCPFHREKTPSFTVSREKQFYYCFGCGASGNAVSFAMEYDRKGFLEALNELAGRVGLEVPDTRDPSAPPRESHPSIRYGPPVPWQRKPTRSARGSRRQTPTPAGRGGCADGFLSHFESWRA